MKNYLGEMLGAAIGFNRSTINESLCTQACGKEAA